MSTQRVFWYRVLELKRAKKEIGVGRRWPGMESQSKSRERRALHRRGDGGTGRLYVQQIIK